MATIGSFSFTGWQGRLRQASQRITLMDSMPGVDGSVATLGSWRADPVGIVTRVDVSTLSEAMRNIREYRYLGGKNTTVVDQFGATWPAVFQAMTPDSEYDMLIGGKYRITTRWMMVVQSLDAT